MNTESQTDRITQLEAACASKDKVINAVRFFLQDYLKSVTHPGVSRLVGDCYAATYTDAGKSLLDRLQKAETRLAEWETLRTNDAATHQNILRGIIALTRPQALHLAGAQDYDELKDRLQAAERENAELNKALALKLDALPSGLSAGQSIALEKRLQAVKAEREAHIATTNQLQSELAQALADRDRYRQGLETIRNRGYTGASFVAGEFLQPAQKGTK